MMNSSQHRRRRTTPWGKKHPFYFLNNSVKLCSMLIIFGTQICEWICNKIVTQLSTSPNECHYTTLWHTTCVSLFITDNCCTNTRHTQLTSSSLLMRNCSQLHHQSICRTTELRTDYHQEVRRCCWPPALQMIHIQRERYGQQDNAPAHRARETIELLRNKTPDFIKPDLLPPDNSDPNPMDYKI